MASGAPEKNAAVEVTNQDPTSVWGICEDIETMKGVVAFLADVGCSGLFRYDNGIGISPEGEIGLNFILQSVVDGLDKISNRCAANLQPKESN